MIDLPASRALHHANLIFAIHARVDGLIYANGSPAVSQLESPRCRLEAASRESAASPAAARAPLPCTGGGERSWISGLSPARSE